MTPETKALIWSLYPNISLDENTVFFMDEIQALIDRVRATAIEDCVSIFLQQHERDKGRHNYWLSAAKSLKRLIK